MLEKENQKEENEKRDREWRREKGEGRREKA
jgi:hypothetical protein